MILKGSQRTGGRDLATHLSNEYDNERIEIASVRGAVADDLHGTLAEFEAVAAGTRAQKPLYSLSINPSAPLSRAQYMAAIDHIEDKLGLTGQPRAIVFHVKDGREHAHVVWSRTDIDTMKAIPISHDRMKLRTCARELAHAYGLQLPPGLAEDRGDARFEKTPEISFAEKAMAEASGITPEARRDAITTLYRSSDSAESFRAGLERAGYVLAQGERRAHVVVDRAGHVHALARQIDGVKTRDVKARLETLPPEALPSIEQAQAQQTQREKAFTERLREQARARGAKSAADLAAKQEARRRRAIDAKRQALEVTHRAERLSLHAAHKAEQDRLFNRIAGKVFALFDRVPALRSVILPLRRNPAINAAERHRLETEALDRRNERERRDIDRRASALDLIDARERRSLIRDLVSAARAEDLVREAQVRQHENEIRQTADELTRDSREERRARVAELLSEARRKEQNPSHGPGRGRSR
ncbi:MAG: relaxase/mobilization nuclease domain-containing protein [Rhodospirillales bacterium]|nr:relaxase/mobilization nuclease domain-containing protein [Rhodospirillales bacterium]